ncbi:MAG: D-glycero-beta-D-manno-heptose-7-phosphate kinase [Proteobacteria bacterium]|nr:MAG: D-glycero-beta-D-manno-heptose-7-phosphate kinase [Pseudomonadota bacterium]
MPGRIDARRLARLVTSFRRVRLLVVGDVVLDEYLWGDVERVSPEAPVPVVHVQRESQVLGGAGNVVRNAIALGASCDFCSAVGEDRAGERVLEELAALGVETEGVVRVAGRPTTRKTRLLARSQQLVRFDRETVEPLPPRAVRSLVAAIERCTAKADGAIVEDYGKGTLAPGVVKSVMRRLVAAGVPVAVDPKDELAPYRGAALVKPNLREAEVLAGMRVRSDADLERVGQRLRRRLGGATVVVTRGADGMALFADDGPALRVATPRREVFDVQGAGDTTIAALALALRAGGTLLEAAVVANAAAGVVVAKVGTATASPEEVLAALPAAADAARVSLRREEERA